MLVQWAPGTQRHTWEKSKEACMHGLHGPWEAFVITRRGEKRGGGRGSHHHTSCRGRISRRGSRCADATPNTILGPGHDPGYRPQTNRGGWGTGQTWDGMSARRKKDIIIPLIRDLIRIVSSSSSSLAAVACKCTPREEVRGKGQGTRTDPLHLPADCEGGQEGNGTPWAV